MDNRTPGDHWIPGWVKDLAFEPVDPSGDLYRRTIEGLKNKLYEETDVSYIRHIPRGGSLNDLLKLACPVCGAIVKTQGDASDVWIIEHVGVLDRCPASGWILKNALD